MLYKLCRAPYLFYLKRVIVLYIITKTKRKMNTINSENETRDKAFISLSKLVLKESEVTPRLQEEMERISANGWESYFLFLHKLAAELDSKRIDFEVEGRICSSLIAYLLHITTLDPEEYDIPFNGLKSDESDGTADIRIRFNQRSLPGDNYHFNTFRFAHRFRRLLQVLDNSKRYVLSADNLKNHLRLLQRGTDYVLDGEFTASMAQEPGIMVIELITAPAKK